MIFKRDEPAWEGGNALLKGMFFASISTYTTGLFEGWMITGTYFAPQQLCQSQQRNQQLSSQ